MKRMVNSRPVTSKQRSVTVKSTKPPTVLGKSAPKKVYKPGEIDKETVRMKSDPKFQAGIAAREAKKKADAETAAVLKKKGIAVNKQNIAGYQKSQKKK